MLIHISNTYILGENELKTHFLKYKCHSTFQIAENVYLITNKKWRKSQSEVVL